MERKDIERMIMLETKIDNMQATITQILSVVNEMRDRQGDYVKISDSSYFYRYMKEYNAESLQKKVGWLTCLDIVYKTMIPIASGFLIHYVITY